MALRYNGGENTTYGYLGYQEGPGGTDSPGQRLHRRLKTLSRYAGSPMFLPSLASGMWAEYLYDANNNIRNELRKIQSDIGLMQPYIQGGETSARKTRRTAAAAGEPVSFDALHQDIVMQHAYLTTGLSEFITDLFLATRNAFRMVKDLRTRKLLHYSSAVDTELAAYVEHMDMRAKADVQYQERMLSRINLYLQVVSRCM